MLKKRITLETLTVRLAGDSGDGIQLIGGEFADVSAFLGNALRVLPDFPAEIRAPAGTQAGVSAYQLQVASKPIYTAGDAVDILVAMNPAALSVNVSQLKPRAVIILNEDAFTEHGYKVAGVQDTLLTSAALDGFEVFKVAMATLTLAALEGHALTHRVKLRAKNLFALGLVLWLYERGLEHSEAFLQKKFKAPAHAELLAANLAALRAGYAYGDASELFLSRYKIAPLTTQQHTRNVTGNAMIAEGLVVGAYRAGLRPFYASYPITPASDILHRMTQLSTHGVISFQAEDEMAAVTAAIGASYGGSLGMTGTSGPGFTLKMEALGLAVVVELPLVVVDVQRAGPATGMPTKGEQADLLLALYGRHNEAPLVVIAAATPGDCFHCAVAACVWAVRYRIPVVVLSDAHLANGMEPWQVPDVRTLVQTEPAFATVASTFKPYLRSQTVPMQRVWALPGMAGFEHRIGGLEKDAETGAVSYDAANHQEMMRTRRAKLDALSLELPPLELLGFAESPLLVLGWGSTYGVLRSVLAECETAQATAPARFAYAHLRYLSPFPPNFTKLLNQYKKLLIVEMNSGQLAQLVRTKTSATIQTLQQMTGFPIKAAAVRAAINKAVA